MNETENKNETTAEQTNETVAETVPEKELTTEEKLAERERVLAEREKAFELKSLKFKAAESLKSKSLPEELSVFLDYESEEAMNESIENLVEIIENNFILLRSGRQVVDVGFSHGTATGNNHDSFLNGFKR